MGEIKAKMSWVEGDRFEGTGAYGNTITIDTPKAAGGTEQGFKPTELLRWGVAGCTGIDVVRILEKQRQKITSLDIEVTGHQGDSYPKPFHTIEVKYIARGENLDPAKLAKAIEHSESKYCVVSQTVAHPGTVKTSYEIVDN